MGDVFGGESGAFGEARFNGLGWESGVDDDLGIGNLQERCGGVSGADGGSLVPEWVCGEGAD